MDVVICQRMTCGPHAGKFCHLQCDKFSTNGLHPPRSLDTLGWARACTRFMADFYARIGVGCEWWLAITQGTTITWEEVSVKDDYHVRIDCCIDLSARGQATEYETFAYLDRWELEGLSREGWHNPVVTSLDGRQAEVLRVVGFA